MKLSKERCPELEQGRSGGRSQGEPLRWGSRSPAAPTLAPLKDLGKHSMWTSNRRSANGSTADGSSDAREELGSPWTFPKDARFLGTGTGSSIGSPPPPSQIGLRPGLQGAGQWTAWCLSCWKRLELHVTARCVGDFSRKRRGGPEGPPGAYSPRSRTVARDLEGLGRRPGAELQARVVPEAGEVLHRGRTSKKTTTSEGGRPPRSCLAAGSVRRKK